MCIALREKFSGVKILKAQLKSNYFMSFWMTRVIWVLLAATLLGMSYFFIGLSSYYSQCEMPVVAPRVTAIESTQESAAPIGCGALWLSIIVDLSLLWITNGVCGIAVSLYLLEYFGGVVFSAPELDIVFPSFDKYRSGKLWIDQACSSSRALDFTGSKEYSGGAAESSMLGTFVAGPSLMSHDRASVKVLTGDEEGGQCELYQPILDLNNAAYSPASRGSGDATTKKVQQDEHLSNEKAGFSSRAEMLEESCCIESDNEENNVFDDNETGDVVLLPFCPLETEPAVTANPFAFPPPMSRDPGWDCDAERRGSPAGQHSDRVELGFLLANSCGGFGNVSFPTYATGTGFSVGSTVTSLILILGGVSMAAAQGMLKISFQSAPVLWGPIGSVRSHDDARERGSANKRCNH